MTTSTNSKCCSAVQVVEVVAGVLVLAGLAALACQLLSRRSGEYLDPLTEADRRIDALEESLHRLHDTVSHTVSN